MASQMRRLTAPELALFCSQMTVVLRTGMFLPDGLSAMAGEERDGVLTYLSQRMREGDIPLADALEESGAFPGYVVNMTRMGEETGKLEDVMSSLCEYYERETGLKKQIKSAVVYPLLLVMMMVVVISVLAVEVLPVFSQVFNELGGAMSSTAAGLMRFGETAGRLAIALVSCWPPPHRSAPHRPQAEEGGLFAVLARAPGFRKVSRKIDSGRFAYALSLTLGSGYSMENALELMPGLLNDAGLIARSERCREEVAGGGSFSKAASDSALFSGMQARMISLGEEAGALPAVMGKISDLCQDEIDSSLSALLSSVEPGNGGGPLHHYRGHPALGHVAPALRHVHHWIEGENRIWSIKKCAPPGRPGSPSPHSSSLSPCSFRASWTCRATLWLKKSGWWSRPSGGPPSIAMPLRGTILPTWNIWRRTTA